MMRKLCYISRFADPYPLLPRKLARDTRSTTDVYSLSLSLSSFSLSVEEETKYRHRFESETRKTFETWWLLNSISPPSGRQAVNERRTTLALRSLTHWRFLGPRLTIITRCTHACPTLRDRGAKRTHELLRHLYLFSFWKEFRLT